MPPKRKGVNRLPLSEQFASRFTEASKVKSIHTYEPHDKQKEFHSSRAKVRLYVGGNRSGKSVGACAEDVYRLRGIHPFQAVPEPPVHGRLVGVDFDNGIEKILMPIITEMIPPSLLINGSWEDSYQKGLRMLTCSNGSTLEFMSYVQEKDKFAGTSRHFVHLDEEPPKGIYEECLLRTLDVGGVIYISMTPLAGMDWTYDELYIPGMTGLSKRISVIEVKVTDNPHISPEEIDELYKDMDDEATAIRRDGLYVHIGGAVFRKFGEHNIIPHDEFNLVHYINRGWKLYASMDHGINNPTAWLWHVVAPEPQLRIITFAEHYKRNWIVKQHATHIKELEKEFGFVPEIRIGDPAINQRSGETGNSIKTAYALEGIYIADGNNDKTSSIDRIISYCQPEHAPHWLVTDNCPNLIWEMKRARWKRHMSDKVKDRKNAFEEMEEKDNHAIDAFRYMINFMPELPHTLPSVDYSEGMRHVQEATGAVRAGRIIVDYGLREPAPQTEWTILETLNDF